MSFWERLYDMCIEKGCKPNTVAKAIGLSTATATKWKSGTIPNGEALTKIADYLGCSVDYLLGRTEKIPAGQTVNGLTKERQALIDLIMACPEERAKDLLTAMQLFLQNWQR